MSILQLQEWLCVHPRVHLSDQNDTQLFSAQQISALFIDFAEWAEHWTNYSHTTAEHKNNCQKTRYGIINWTIEGIFPLFENYEKLVTLRDIGKKVLWRPYSNRNICHCVLPLKRKVMTLELLYIEIITSSNLRTARLVILFTRQPSRAAIWMSRNAETWKFMLHVIWNFLKRQVGLTSDGTKTSKR